MRAAIHAAAALLALSGCGFGVSLAIAADRTSIPAAPATDPAIACDSQAQSATCMLDLELPDGAGRLAYYVSALPQTATSRGPASALVVLHGHSRDGARSFNAGLAAARAAGLGANMLVAAPLFQVDAQKARRCSSEGEPAPRTRDALWSCAGWIAGSPSRGEGRATSFAALDRLVADLKTRWPSLQSVTIAGFSAGAQLAQHYAGFAAKPPEGMSLRFVVADPGTYLYFDRVRPALEKAGTAVADPGECGAGEDYPGSCRLSFAEPGEQALANCPNYDRWKYGTTRLPKRLGIKPEAARERYRQAEIAYLAGALDGGPGRGTFNRLLDHGCAAELQGPFRLQRAAAYAAYDRDILAPPRSRPLTVVPGCAHDVACVFTAPEARSALFGTAR